MTGVGLAALPEGGRVDFPALRAARRARLVGAMAALDLDVLVLGRPADVTYASGVRQLWTAGSRPFSPACLLVRDGAEVRTHVLATWDEGVPAEIPREQLFGLSWNPAVRARHIAAIAGLSEARRIGADGTSAGFRRLVATVAPEAEVVDARAAVQTARSIKTTDERRAIETACALAEAGLEAMVGQVHVGVTTRLLLGVHAARLGALGAPVVPDDSVARTTAGGLASVVDDVPLVHGDVVALSPSASYAGYEGTIARTTVVGADPSPDQVELRRRCRGVVAAIVAACRVGAGEADLVAARDAAGGGASPPPLAHGIGLGAERPLFGFGLDTTCLAAGMVLAVQAFLHEPGAGGWLERDVLVVGDDRPQLLTRTGHP